MLHFRAATILLSTVLACASASADTLDFEPFGSGERIPATLDLSGTLIEGYGSSLFIIANDVELGIPSGAGGAVCSAYRPEQDILSCAADMRITFKTAVNNLSLQTFGYDDGDSVTISAWAGSSLLGSQVVTGNGTVDFTALTDVTKLEFDDQSSGLNGGSGFAYSKFSFTPLASPVPEPATGLLMVLGVAALGQFARRRQAT